MERTWTPFVQHGLSTPGLSILLGVWTQLLGWADSLERCCPGTTQGLIHYKELPQSKEIRYEINPNFSDSLVTTNCFPHLIFFPFSAAAIKRGKSTSK